jgi:hypothetical protein
MGAARACYVGLIGMCALGDCYAQFLGWNQATLLGLPKAALIERLTAVTAEELDQASIEAFVDLMTFRPERHADPAHAPLVPWRDRLLLAPGLLSPRGIERTLLRSAAADPNRFGPVGQALGRQADAWADLFAGLPGIQAARRLQVSHLDGAVAGDLDIVAVDPLARVGVIVEAKWPIDALSIREGSKIEDWITKARAQLLQVRQGLEAGRVRVRLPAGWPEFSSIRWHWLVGTPQQLDGRLGQPNADLIPALSLRLAEALPHDSPLAQFLKRLCDPPRPQQHEDYTVEQHEFRVGRYRVTADALVLLREDWAGWA